jgi:transposase-like protein
VAFVEFSNDDVVRRIILSMGDINSIAESLDDNQDQEEVWRMCWREEERKESSAQGVGSDFFCSRSSRSRFFSF